MQYSHYMNVSVHWFLSCVGNPHYVYSRKLFKTTVPWCSSALQDWPACSVYPCLTGQLLAVSFSWIAHFPSTHCQGCVFSGNLLLHLWRCLPVCTSWCCLRRPLFLKLFLQSLHLWGFSPWCVWVDFSFCGVCHSHYTCEVFLHCVWVGVVWGDFCLWSIWHIHHTCEFSGLYVWACVSAYLPSVWSIFHSHHTCEVSLLYVSVYVLSGCFCLRSIFHRHHTCELSCLYVCVGVFSYYSAMWNIFHIHHIRKASPVCVEVGAFWDNISFWSACHIPHICKASPVCVQVGVLWEYFDVWSTGHIPHIFDVHLLCVLTCVVSDHPSVQHTSHILHKCEVSHLCPQVVDLSPHSPVWTISHIHHISVIYDPQYKFSLFSRLRTSVPPCNPSLFEPGRDYFSSSSWIQRINLYKGRLQQNSPFLKAADRCNLVILVDRCNQGS